MMRVASCSDDISSEKKPTMPPLAVVMGSVRLRLAAIGARDIEGDIGGERGLAHARAPGDDDEIGGLQAAHHLVEVVHAAGDAGQAALALPGLGGHVDGAGQGLGEAVEAAFVAPGLGDGVELALGLLDLHARAGVHARVDRRC